MDTGIECCVCFNRFDRQEHKKHTLRCGHSFCLSCVNEWKRAQGATYSCPICRRKFSNRAPVPQTISRPSVIQPAGAAPRRPCCSLRYVQYVAWIAQIVISFALFIFALFCISAGTNMFNDECGPYGTWEMSVPQCNTTAPPPQCEVGGSCDNRNMAIYQRKGGFPKVLWLLKVSIAINAIACAYWLLTSICAIATKFRGFPMERVYDIDTIYCVPWLTLGLAAILLIAFTLFGIIVGIGVLVKNEIDYGPNRVLMGIAWPLQILNGSCTLIMQWIIQLPFITSRNLGDGTYEVGICCEAR